jgi:hypothetical protein
MSPASFFLVVVGLVVIGVAWNAFAGAFRRVPARPYGAGNVRNDTVAVAQVSSPAPVWTGRAAVQVVAPEVRRKPKHAAVAADSGAGWTRAREPEPPTVPLSELRPLDRQPALRAISPLAPMGARKVRTDAWRS